jgi:hypothetical protein
MARFEETRNTYNILVGKFLRKCSFLRLRRRPENYIRIYVTDMGYEGGR